MSNRERAGKRLAVLWIIIGALLAVCLIRAVYLVSKKGDEYNKKALALSTGSGSVIQAKPGDILDRNGAVLACTKRVYRLILDPSVMKQTEENYKGSAEATVQLLSEVFGIDRTKLIEAILNDEDSAYVRFTDKTVFPDDGMLSEDQYAAWNTAVEEYTEKRAEHNEENPDDRITAKITGVWFEEEYRRYYPEKDLLCKVIGFATKDVRQGLTGLELSYDDELRGTDGRVIRYISDDGTVNEEVKEAEDGGTLITSLDRNVSEYCRDAIDRFMTDTGAKRVNVLVMDPNTCEIIAMESDTRFDLNDPSNPKTVLTEEEREDPTASFLLQEAFKSEKQKAVLDAMSKDDQISSLIQQKQLNYAVSGTFEPGSTAKTLTIAAGIEEGLITEDSKFNCTGEIQVDRYTIHCHMDEACGTLNPMEALARSCNVCLVQISERIGAQLFAKFQELFNLGQKTGVDLPGEAETKNLIYYEDNMGETELATCSFGQGFNVTMIQMAAAYASVINGGSYYEPHVVTGITDNEGCLIRKIEPELVRRTISEETAAYLKEALCYVVEKGTATTAGEDGYLMGGKTGAAEKLPRGTGKYIVSFIGAAPVEQPRFLVYVVVDEPDVEDQSMSLPAQELAHDIFSGLYRYYNIYPESDPDAYSYDWSGLSDFSGISDSMNGESNVNVPAGEDAENAAAPPTEAETQSE